MSTYDDIFLQAMEGESSLKQNHQPGEVQKGKVISQEDKGFFIATGGKSEMILPSSEMVGTVAVGDEIEFVFTGVKDGIPQVSQKKALYAKALINLQKSMEESTPVSAKIIKIIANKEAKNIGYIASIDGVEAFLPFSQIRVPKDEKELLGQMFDVVVIKFEGDRLVVSERMIRDQLQKENFEIFIAAHKEGDKVSATVSSIAEAFALVSAEGITMFLHITQFDWKYVKNLSDVLKVGDQFDVIIGTIDTAKKSIKVSRKNAIENPMVAFFNSTKIGANIAAKVVRFARGLTILEDDNGVEMILPVGEMSWLNRVSDPKHLLKIGDRVEVKIKDMDHDKQRISVSLRDLLENPWTTADTKYALKTTHQGTVTAITDFGIFASFDDGIQGLIRIEDIEWTAEEIKLNERFKKGDSVTALVLNIEASKEKLRLGIKQLSKNPFQNFADAHKIGSIVSGTVTKIMKEGAELDLGDHLTAFIHISQLSTEMVTDVANVCKVGDVIQAAVRRVNIQQQNIELSVKELARAEEQKTLNTIMSAHVQETPTLGSIFGDLLNKK